MRRIGLLGIFLALLCVLVLALGAAISWVMTDEVTSVGNAFMTALQNNDMERAYALFHPALQQEVSLEAFEAMMVNNVLGTDALDSWRFTALSGEGRERELVGTASVGGRPFDVILRFVRDSGWELSGYTFQPVP